MIRSLLLAAALGVPASLASAATLRVDAVPARPKQGDIVFVTDDPIEDIGEVMALISPVLSLGLSSAAFILSIQDNNNTTGN